MKDKTFDVLYYKRDVGNGRLKFSHKCSETWAETSLFCPNCGAKEVWHDTGEGCYYNGEKHICTDCSAVFTLPVGANPADNNGDVQRFKHLS